MDEANKEVAKDPVELLPDAVRSKFDAMPPFIQDAILRGARMQSLLNDTHWAQLEAAAGKSNWDQAAATLSQLAPKLPPESVLEALLIYFAVCENNARADLVRSLLELLASHTTRLREEGGGESGRHDPLG